MIFNSLKTKKLFLKLSFFIILTSCSKNYISYNNKFDTLPANFIINGKELPVNHPFSAVVKLNSGGTATLISNQILLMAAHSVKPINEEFMGRKVKLIKHPKYGDIINYPDPGHHDIAIGILDEPLQLDKDFKFISICQKTELANLKLKPLLFLGYGDNLCSPLFPNSLALECSGKGVLRYGYTKFKSIEDSVLITKDRRGAISGGGDSGAPYLTTNSQNELCQIAVNFASDYISENRATYIHQEEVYNFINHVLLSEGKLACGVNLDCTKIKN